MKMIDSYGVAIGQNLGVILDLEISISLVQVDSVLFAHEDGVGNDHIATRVKHLQHETVGMQGRIGNGNQATARLTKNDLHRYCIGLITVSGYVNVLQCEVAGCDLE